MHWLDAQCSTLRLDRLLRGLDIHANMHAPTGNQVCRQTENRAYAQTSAERKVCLDRRPGIPKCWRVQSSRVLGRPRCLLLCSHRNRDDSPFSSEHLECKEHHQPSGHPFSAKIKCFHQSCVCLCLPRLYLPRVIVNWLHCKIYSVRWRDS